MFKRFGKVERRAARLRKRRPRRAEYLFVGKAQRVERLILSARSDMVLGEGIKESPDFMFARQIFRKSSAIVAITADASAVEAFCCRRKIFQVNAFGESKDCFLNVQGEISIYGASSYIHSSASIDMRALKLIFVSDGYSNDEHWIAIDGDEESLRPEALIAAHADLLRDTIRDGSVRIVESRCETRIFTKDAKLHSALLERLKSDLPER